MLVLVSDYWGDLIKNKSKTDKPELMNDEKGKSFLE